METGRRCVMCPRSILRRRRHILQDTLAQSNPELVAYISEHGSVQIVFNNIMAVCHRCWQRAHTAVVQQRPENAPLVVEDQEPELQIDGDNREPSNDAVDQDSDFQNNPEQENRDFHVRDYVRPPNSSRSCMYRQCNNHDLRRPPKSMKLHLVCHYRLYIPPSARICNEHLENNDFDELLDNVNVTHSFDSFFFSNLTNMLIEAINNRSRFDFESLTSLNDSELHYWTGLTLQQFNNILEETPSLSENTRNPRSVLGAYLTKLRTGESNERLATLFGVTRQVIEYRLKKARRYLTQDYVPRHLGLDHISRDELLSGNLYLPKNIFGNEENTKLLIIADGTYVYIEKSSNFLFQRKSYSHHKFRNLLKPFILVNSDGYIIDVIGPFSATTSDATIMQKIMNDDENVWHWLLNRGDVFILDWGFRDSIHDIESLGYEPYMPPTKDRQATQLSTEQANDSRLVTICRWVVEAVKGKFKNRFRLLKQTYFNRTLPNMFIDFRMAASIINASYRVATDNRLATEICDIIRSKIDTPNLLHHYVEGKNLNRQRTNFVSMEANMPHFEEFPQLTDDDIVLFALGTYHIKLAKSYCAEHFRNGLYCIELYRDNELHDLSRYNMSQNNAWLVRARIQSRHVRSRVYYSYILINHSLAGRDAITQWYCTCLTRARTIGSCAHIISIIWYMGKGRHIEFNLPAQMLSHVIIDELL